MVRRARALPPTSPASSPPFEHVARVCAQLVPGGTVLPATNVLGPMGFPIVALDHAAHRARADSGQGPMRSFDSIARVVYGGDLTKLPRSAVSLLAFFSTRSGSIAARELRSVRAYCRTVALVPHDDIPGEPLLSEFDFFGITVVSVDAEDVVVHVNGDPGRAPGSDIALAWSRLREEQLYAAALAHPGVVTRAPAS